MTRANTLARAVLIASAWTPSGDLEHSTKLECGNAFNCLKTKGAEPEAPEQNVPVAAEAAAFACFVNYEAVRLGIEKATRITMKFFFDEPARCQPCMADTVVAPVPETALCSTC